jgi:hypothetical protein
MGAELQPQPMGEVTEQGLWRCPGCHRLFPVAQLTDSSFMPVQPTLVEVLDPIANIVGLDGKPRTTGLPQLLSTSRCRRTMKLIPHEQCCVPWAQLRRSRPPMAIVCIAETPETVETAQ